MASLNIYEIYVKFVYVFTVMAWIALIRSGSLFPWYWIPMSREKPQPVSDKGNVSVVERQASFSGCCKRERVYG